MQKEGIKIEKKDIEIALYVIELKIAQEIRNSKNYQELKLKVEPLLEEKEAIYRYEEEVISKVINIYLPEVK